MGVYCINPLREAWTNTANAFPPPPHTTSVTRSSSAYEAARAALAEATQRDPKPVSSVATLCSEESSSSDDDGSDGSDGSDESALEQAESLGKEGEPDCLESELAELYTRHGLVDEAALAVKNLQPGR
jgi:hypothetical protein